MEIENSLPVEQMDRLQSSDATESLRQAAAGPLIRFDSTDAQLAALGFPSVSIEPEQTLGVDLSNIKMPAILEGNLSSLITAGAGLSAILSEALRKSRPNRI